MHEKFTYLDEFKVKIKNTLGDKAETQIGAVG
jgi:hypothetical protein